MSRNIRFRRSAVSILLVLCLCAGFPVTPARASTSQELALAQQQAEQLKALGLFQGVSDTDFALERPPTRAEALVMLIRVLGQEQTALSSAWGNPFTDVDEWADRYIGYAYQTGLTKGISATEFGRGNANAWMYLTFLLRALGYSDAPGGDFSDPFDLARQLGLYSRDSEGEEPFLRADVVLLSHSALEIPMKGGTETLADKLIREGAFTREQYAAAISRGAGARTELSAKEIYAMCSPAVFCIYTYNFNGEAVAQGSGFFIDRSGVAVTNCHVLTDAISAKAFLTDGRELDITQVYVYDQEEDYAVIQVSGSGFEKLSVGDSASVAGGEKVYAIGNPQGLTNTITDGIISNPRRDDIYGYIQTSAPISHGSSGGALINAYGEVIGVTAASYAEGQNLNFAVPINAVMEAYRRGGSGGTMMDFAKDTGYIGDTTLYSAAWQCLSQFISAHYNELFSGHASYKERRGSDTVCRAIYNSKGREVILSAARTDAGGAQSICYVYVPTRKGDLYFEYSQYTAGGGNPACSGSGRLSNGGFTDYSGPASSRDWQEKTAWELVLELSGWVDALLKSESSASASLNAAQLGLPRE